MEQAAIGLGELLEQSKRLRIGCGQLALEHVEGFPVVVGKRVKRSRESAILLYFLP